MQNSSVGADILKITKLLWFLQVAQPNIEQFDPGITINIFTVDNFCVHNYIWQSSFINFIAPSEDLL